MSKTEIWSIVDERGIPTGKTCMRCERSEIPDGLYHPVVEVWVRVGEVIHLTQRHPEKWAGLKWESSGGAALAGEDYTFAAARELYEESGIFVSERDLVLLGYTKRGKSLIISYLAIVDSRPTVTLQECEVVASRFVTRCELEGEMWDELTEGTRERYLLYKDKIFA